MKKGDVSVCQHKLVGIEMALKNIRQMQKQAQKIMSRDRHHLLLPKLTRAHDNNLNHSSILHPPKEKSMARRQSSIGKKMTLLPMDEAEDDKKNFLKPRGIQNLIKFKRKAHQSKLDVAPPEDRIEGKEIRQVPRKMQEIATLRVQQGQKIKFNTIEADHRNADENYSPQSHRSSRQKHNFSEQKKIKQTLPQYSPDLFPKQKKRKPRHKANKATSFNSSNIKTLGNSDDPILTQAQGLLFDKNKVKTQGVHQSLSIRSDELKIKKLMERAKIHEKSRYQLQDSCERTQFDLRYTFAQLKKKKPTQAQRKSCGENTSFGTMELEYTPWAQQEELFQDDYF